MRTSIYKDKIIKLLKKNHLMSIGDIHKLLPKADYSTVYRNVEQLIDDGDIKKIVFEKDKIMYEVSDKNSQHDHFICTNCGSVDELERSSLEFKSLKKYVVEDVIVRGICQGCH